MNDKTDDALYRLTLEQLEELYETPEALAKRDDLTPDAKRDILRRWKAAAEHAHTHTPESRHPSLITLIGRLLAAPIDDDQHLREELDQAAEGQDF